MLNTNHLSFIYSFLLSLAFLLLMHVGRHTYATTAMSFGVPIATIAKTMGHANMKMTQHYARVLPEKIIKDINVLNTATQTLQTLYQ